MSRENTLAAYALGIGTVFVLAHFSRLLKAATAEDSTDREIREIIREHFSEKETPLHIARLRVHSEGCGHDHSEEAGQFMPLKDLFEQVRAKMNSDAPDSTGDATS